MGTCAVVPVRFEVCEEGADEGTIEVVDRQLRGRLVQLPVRILHQQAEGVSVAGNGVRADLALLHEPLREKPREKPREVGRGVHGIGLRRAGGRPVPTAPEPP